MGSTSSWNDSESTQDSDGLIIDCNSGSCTKLEIYCPYSAKCDINCRGENSCYLSDFHIENNDYILNDNFNLYCNESIAANPSQWRGSCYGVNIQCDEPYRVTAIGYSIYQTELYYNDINMDYQCLGYGCCPLQFFEPETICTPNQPCNIDCKLDDCRYINGSQASELVVNCNSIDTSSGKGCRSSNIICPVSNTANCTILCPETFACYESVITLPDKSYEINNLQLECTGSSACDYMEIIAPTSSPTTPSPTTSKPTNAPITESPTVTPTTAVPTTLEPTIQETQDKSKGNSLLVNQCLTLSFFVVFFAL